MSTCSAPSARDAAEMALRQGAGYTEAEVDDLARRDAKPKGVLHILRALEQRILRGPEDLHRIAYEYLEDAASQGVRHAEIFWNPTGTARDAGIPIATARTPSSPPSTTPSTTTASPPC
jgi:hypothetical protein